MKKSSTLLPSETRLTTDEGFRHLIDCGKQFYDRQWMWGTSGNLSVKLRQTPLSIAITASGINKGHMKNEELLVIDDGKEQKPHNSGLVPSSETIIHQEIHRALPGCGAVFHVHPMHATLISYFYGHPTEIRTLTVDWMEVLKGVGINEDQKGQILILPNWQDVSKIAKDITHYLSKTKGTIIPAVLIYNHGLTGWGTSPDHVRNTLEIMEYVCQYLYMKRLATKAG